MAVQRSIAPLTFKIASEPWEFEQIHRLNYQTFVEEIPQHETNRSGSLVDKFHHENTYIICLRGDELLGMMAVRDTRPFSLDEKLEDLDTYLPDARAICEIRLLAVERGHRHGTVLHGLFVSLVHYCRHRGFDLLIISGTVRQRRLYERLGFVPFGPLVGAAGALFQPMYLTPEAYRERASLFEGARRPSGRASAPVNLLPGPVGIGTAVRRAFAEAPVSHRSGSFMADVRQTKHLLCDLVHARHVEIVLGTGTLANDMVAGQLSLLSGRGVILSNGEFGERLVDHAARFRLDCTIVRTDWGGVFDPDAIGARLAREPQIGWLWAVHCETSTGVLNDVAMLQAICADRGLRLCLDCISSIGAVPVDLADVYLASGVSGKGLGSFPGLAMVFYNHAVEPAPRALPRYLDLGLYAASDGIPFTHSSNLVSALRTALQTDESTTISDTVRAHSSDLRMRLRELGFDIVADDAHASPAVTTIALPRHVNSEYIGARLREAGYLLSYESTYLVKRNWIQVCLMGEYEPERLGRLPDLLYERCLLPADTSTDRR
jgi:aspartate aminotransferase-like enzyme